MSDEFEGTDYESVHLRRTPEERERIRQQQQESMKNKVWPDPVAEQNAEFDRTIGNLDFVLSKLMGYAKDAEQGRLSAPNRQTLKHHAEDMEAAAKAIYRKLGINQEGTPQPSK